MSTQPTVQSAPPGTWKANSEHTRRAVRGATIGFFVDMFDIYLPVIVLAPALIYFVPSHLSDSTKAVVAGGIFAATLLGRPVGSVVFGLVADRIGRRRSTVMAVLGCGVTTTLTGFFPGYAQFGVGSIILLIVARFIGGIFMGGEYTGAIPLAMESSPISKRGAYSGLINGAFPLAYCTISIITFGLLRVLPSEGVGSAYVQWGWRVPFLIGGVMTLWFAWYYSTRVSESEAWAARRGSSTTNPIHAFIRRGDLRRTLLRVFVVMTGCWFVSNVVSVILPAVIQDKSKVGNVGATFIWIVCQVFLTLAYLAAGRISQRVGRKSFFTYIGVTTLTISAVAVTLISTGVVTGYAVILVASLALCFSTSVYGTLPAFVCESFPVEVRGTGYGLGFSLAIIIPAFYAFYQGLLSEFMPREFTPAVLLVVGGVLIIFGARFGPETKDRDMGMTTEELRSAGSF